MGKRVIQILAAVAEAGRERILERTSDGIAAMASGVKCGRTPYSATVSAFGLIWQGQSFKIVPETRGYPALRISV